MLLFSLNTIKKFLLFNNLRQKLFLVNLSKNIYKQFKSKKFTTVACIKKGILTTTTQLKTFLFIAFLIFIWKWKMSVGWNWWGSHKNLYEICLKTYIWLHIKLNKSFTCKTLLLHTYQIVCPLFMYIKSWLNWLFNKTYIL